MTSWDDRVSTVAVKHARDRFAAQLVPVPEARAAIESTREAALGRIPSVPTPAERRTLTVRWQSASVPAHLIAIPGVERRDDRTVVVEGVMLDLYRLFCLYLRVATAVTTNPPYC